MPVKDCSDNGCNLSFELLQTLVRSLDAADTRKGARIVVYNVYQALKQALVYSKSKTARRQELVQLQVV